MSHESDSEELRAALTRIDRQIAKLVDDRAALILKPPPPGSSLPPRDPTAAVHDEDRPLPKYVRAATLDAILSDVRRACAEAGDPLRIAFPSAWENDAAAAAVSRWGTRATLVECPTLESSISATQRGQADYALVPYVVAGDGFHRATLRALAATESRMTDCLVAPAGRDAMGLAGSTERPHTVFVGRGCRPCVTTWLAASEARVVEVGSTSEACSLAARDPGTWAIAPAATGHAFGLTTRESFLADDAARHVVLALVGGRPPSRTGHDRVAVVLSPHDGPGALAEVLRELAEQRLNVAAIQSMSLGQESSDAHVFIVVDGHLTDRPIVLAFERLRKLVRVLKVVGGYAPTAP